MLASQYATVTMCYCHNMQMSLVLQQVSVTVCQCHIVTASYCTCASVVECHSVLVFQGHNGTWHYWDRVMGESAGLLSRYYGLIIDLLTRYGIPIRQHYNATKTLAH